MSTLYNSGYADPPFPCRGIKSIKKKTKTGFTNMRLPVTKEVSHGVETVFIRLNKTTGLKLFKRKNHAMRSYKRQIRAYHHGIAPKLMSPVMTLEIAYRTRKSRTFYGYKTEIARIQADYNLNFSRKAELRLSKILNNIGISSNDLHNENVGKIGNRWVVIDFGDISAVARSSNPPTFKNRG